MAGPDDLRNFGMKIRGLSQEVFVETANAFHDGIKNGSAITGAPGQPVDTGNLRDSWQLTFPEQHVAEISTNAAYALPIEEGTRNGRAMTLRSKTGGFHSVSKMLHGAQKVVDAAVAKVRGG